MRYLKYYTPLTLFLLILLDGHITSFFHGWWAGSYMPTAHLVIVALMCLVQVFPRNYLLITTTILGIIFDSYYLGIIGIYAVTLPLLVFIMYGMASVANRNLFTMFFASIIYVTLYEIITVTLQLIFNIISINPSSLITQVLGPTLLLNMVLFLVFIVPFKKLFAIK